MYRLTMTYRIPITGSVFTSHVDDRCRDILAQTAANIAAQPGASVDVIGAAIHPLPEN